MLATALASVALLPGLLTPTVADVKQDTKVPILLPSSLTTQETKQLYGGGEGEARSYTFAVSTVKNCSANACAVAATEKPCSWSVSGPFSFAYRPETK